MEIPVVPMKHTDVAVALIAQCLEAFDGGTPTTGLTPRLDEIAEVGEVPDLVAALAYVGAGLAVAASQAATKLVGTADADTVTPEAILARINNAVQEQ